MANPRPASKFQKGNKLGRKPGQPNLMPGEVLERIASLHARSGGRKGRRRSDCRG